MIKINNVFIKINKIDILKNINLEIQKEEKVFIIGSSGAGKTTLLNAFMNPSIISKGEIIIDKVNLTKINKKKIRKQNINFGLLSQKDFFINWETVYFNIKNLYPNYKNNLFRFFNIFFKKDKKEIFKFAEQLKIKDILFKKISDISGGEKQRIKILLLMLQKPSIIFADEPTTSLDIKKSKEIIDYIFKIKNSLLILNIHKLDLIPKNAKRIVAIKKGEIFFDGPKNKLDEKMIKEIYE